MADAPLHIVLLAGGSGTRFWPLSRAGRPKQLLALSGSRTLLQETWRRVRRLAPPRRIWVAAPAALADRISRELPSLRPDRLIVEPSPRDTAPAVALACATVGRADPDATLAIFPTDHVIADTPAFLRSVKRAVRAAGEGSLVCLGVKPDRPATGFGYLKCARIPRAGHAVAVERFVEKPDLGRARRFLRSGRYLWNAGMFVWRADSFLAELARSAPRIHRAVEGHLQGRARSWSRATRLSVDFAVMEHARDVQVVALDAGWDDVGSWEAAARLRGTAGRGAARRILEHSDGSVVFVDGSSSDKLVALVGVPNVAVIDTPDALLVVSLDRAEDVRNVVAELRRRGRSDLL